VLAVSGWWGASLHVFDTRDWTRRWEVGPRGDKGTSGGCSLSIPNERRLYAMDSCYLNTHLCECHDLRSGAVLFRGEDLGCMTMDGTSDDRLVVAQSVLRPSAVLVLDGRDFARLFETWLRPDAEGTTVPISFGVDGTYDGVAHGPRDLVAAADPALGASPAAAAPWLLDPLHVRTLCNDSDRSPRRVPRALLRARTEQAQPAPRPR